MKSTIFADFLLFVVGLAVFVLILSTAFAQNIVANILNYVAIFSPQFLADDAATFLTVSAYTPGNVESSQRLTVDRTFAIMKVSNKYYISVFSTRLNYVPTSLSENNAPFATNPYYTTVDVSAAFV